MRASYIALLSIVTMSPLFTGCQSQEAAICSAICECEHCSDIKEDYICASWEVQAETSDIYGCGDEWEDYATCYEEQGECNETEADYSTRAQGSCSQTTQSAMTCTETSECETYYPGGTCQNGNCYYRSCNDESSMMCESDSDCTFGSDRCADERDRLSECIDDASDNSVGIDID